MRATLAITILALTIGTAAAAKPPTQRELAHTSWGKPGVSLEQYRIDAGVCAYRAMNLDISDTPAAKRMIMASRAMDAASASWMNAPAAWSSIAAGSLISLKQVENAYRVDEQMAAISDTQYQALWACLQDRGYHRFQLTQEQAKELRHFRHGSLARQVYLHRFGSDQAVLQAQAL